MDRSPESVSEDELAEIDRQLMDAVEAELDEATRADLRADAQSSLASYRERMPAKVYDAAVASAYRRRLRRKLGLPRLSLYL